jgi:outer membrane protein assembly factor BamE (lipoprotein component of BamABCDE complex)
VLQSLNLQTNFLRVIKFKFLLFSFTIIFLAIACSNASQIEQNIQNAKKLKVGMALDEALQIMGKPHIIKEHANYKGVYDYFYESPFGASDWIYFEVDSTQKLIQVTTY